MFPAIRPIHPGMSMESMNRSQAILRMPVDMIDAVMILHDGVRVETLLFIPPSEDVELLLTRSKLFVPVCIRGQEQLIARTAIATFGVQPEHAPQLTEDLPITERLVTIKLRSGVLLEGKLRWIAEPGIQRTTDYLDSDSPVIALHASDAVYIIAKAHIEMVS